MLDRSRVVLMCACVLGLWACIGEADPEDPFLHQHEQGTIVEDGGPTDGGECVCVGTVPEGDLDVACGEVQCFGPIGYHCLAEGYAPIVTEPCELMDSEGGPEELDGGL